MPGKTNDSDWDLAPTSWGGEGAGAIEGWEEVPKENIPKKEKAPPAPKKVATPEEIEKAEKDIARIEKLVFESKRKQLKTRSRLNELDVVRKGLRDAIDPIRAEMEVLKTEKNSIIAKKEVIAPRGQNAGAQNRNAAKKAVPFHSIAELNKAIASVEFEMNHGSLSLKEEKEALLQIKELKALTPAVEKYEKEFGVTEVDKQDQQATREQLKPLNARFDELKALQDTKFKRLNELRDELSKINAEGDELRQSLKDANSSLDKEYDHVKSLRAAHPELVAGFFKRIAEQKPDQEFVPAAKAKPATPKAPTTPVANGNHPAPAAPAPAAAPAAAAAKPEKKKSKKDKIAPVPEAGRIVAPEPEEPAVPEEERRRIEAAAAYEKYLAREAKTEETKRLKAEKAARKAEEREIQNAKKAQAEALARANAAEAEQARQAKRKAAQAKASQENQDVSGAPVKVVRKKKGNSLLPRVLAENQVALLAGAGAVVLGAAWVIAGN